MHESFGSGTNQGAAHGAERGGDRTSRQADDAAGDGAGRRGPAGCRVPFVLGIERKDVRHFIHAREQLHDACRHDGCI